MAEPQVRRVHVVGVGPGDPEQVTFEAVAALRSCAYLVVSDKSATAGGTGMPDPLVAARGRLLERHLDVVPPVVRVVDPPRERRPEATATTGGYLAAVEDWHEARAAAYEEAPSKRKGKRASVSQSSAAANSDVRRPAALFALTLCCRSARSRIARRSGRSASANSNTCAGSRGGCARTRSRRRSNVSSSNGASRLVLLPR